METVLSRKHDGIKTYLSLKNSFFPAYVPIDFTSFLNALENFSRFNIICLREDAKGPCKRDVTRVRARVGVIREKGDKM